MVRSRLRDDKRIFIDALGCVRQGLELRHMAKYCRKIKDTGADQ